jgi:hypothetical protein
MFHRDAPAVVGGFGFITRKVCKLDPFRFKIMEYNLWLGWKGVVLSATGL